MTVCGKSGSDGSHVSFVQRVQPEICTNPERRAGRRDNRRRGGSQAGGQNWQQVDGLPSGLVQVIEKNQSALTAGELPRGGIELQERRVFD